MTEQWIFKNSTNEDGSLWEGETVQFPSTEFEQIWTPPLVATNGKPIGASPENPRNKSKQLKKKKPTEINDVRTQEKSQRERQEWTEKSKKRNRWIFQMC